METTANKNIATITHLSTLTQYFFPFGNFILPIVIWSSAKKNSSFVDSHGRQAINFQLSIFLYSVILGLIAIPILVFSVFRNVKFSEFGNHHELLIENFSIANITGIALIAIVAIMIFFMMKVAEFFLVIIAAVKAANGEVFQYPLSIAFIKGNKFDEPTISEKESSTE